MKKQTVTMGQRNYLRSLLFGVMGAVLFLGLLLTAAILSGKRSEIMELRRPIVKACLLLSAFISGAMAGGRAEQGKLPHALISEGFLFLLLAVTAVVNNSEVPVLSFLIDVMLMLFGAFAGTQLKNKRKNIRRGKR